MSWLSLVIGQNRSRQLATSSENLVASAQFLVALATSELQFQALVEERKKCFLHGLQCKQGSATKHGMGIGLVVLNRHNCM